MSQLSGVPILILKEGTERRRGKDAQRNNISAAIAVAEAVRTTLGPKGMDKMIVDSLGDVTITNDGATILDTIDVEHPAAKMIVEIAKTQDDKVGDGTTTSVVIAGELLNLAQELMDQQVHPTIVFRGYRKALVKSKEILQTLSSKIQSGDKKILKQVAETSMNSKLIAGAKSHFANIAVDAISQIKEKRGDNMVIDLDQIQIIKKEGKSLLDTKIVDGIIVDKEIVHPMMPKNIKNAKIALINSSLEVEKTEFDAEIKVQTPDQINQFLQEESNMLRKRVNKLKEVGANIVFCQKGVDDKAQNFLAKKNIMTIRRVKKSDMEKLARATDAKIVNNIFEISESDLGNAGKVEEKKIGDDNMIFVSECASPKAVSILIRAGIEHVVDEAERMIHDALSVVKAAIEVPYVLPGGGASEIELAKRLRTFARTIGGREQLAIEVYANALEIVPKTLVENAGYNPVDLIVELRSKHENEENTNYGINIDTGKSDNMVNLGVVEPLAVLNQAIQSATEVASMILKIDDVIAASGLSKGGGME
ncbi:MAG: thermosome subunit [Candidatus Lokiarchaeota archaeon]|nr:thermosome subunit [Candidatus Lokiarchaeota archaeon]MBD3201039.1 thermosome subunit [Candidatus Lokiarchaeota archaeon]